ncbi:MAG: transposase domain-containing protein [Bacteroides stercoris]
MASLEQSLYWLRKKMFGRMSEKNLPLDPNQLSLFTQQEMSPDEKAGLEEETRKAEEEMTRTIKVKDKPVRKPLDTSLLPVRKSIFTLKVQPVGLKTISLKSEPKRLFVWNVSRKKSI